MRIAIFAKSMLVHGMGGMETHLESLCRELVVRGHVVQVVTTRHPAGITVEEKPGLRIRYLNEAPPGRYSQVWWPASRRAFDELMAEDPLDLVLGESLAVSSIARIRSRPPVCPFIHGLVLPHVISEWSQRARWGDTLRFLAVKVPELIYYAFVHERRLFRMAEAVLATHDQLVRSLTGRCRRVILSYNGVDVRCFAPDQERRSQVRKRLGVAEDEIVVLLAGVMTRQKGMHVGIGAFDRLAGRFPRLRLLVVGSGPEEGSLRALAAGSPVSSRIDFVGGLAHSEMPGYFNAADIFLHPSLRVEGLPGVIVEAMASGLPLVATDMGGTKTAVIDGWTGILVPKGDREKLTAAIATLVTDRSLAARLAGAGLRLARDRFAWSEITDRLLADLANLGSGR